MIDVPHIIHCKGGDVLSLVEYDMSFTKSRGIARRMRVCTCDLAVLFLVQERGVNGRRLQV